MTADATSGNLLPEPPTSGFAEEGGKTSPAPMPATLGEKPALQEYVNYALERNPELRAAYHRWQAAMQRIPQARALPEPTLSYSYLLREIEDASGEKQNELEIMQMLPWPQELAAKSEAALRNAETEKYLFLNTRLEIRGEVHKAYYEYLFLNRSIAVMKETLDLLHGTEQTLQSQYEVSAAPGAELIRVQVELGKIENQLASMTDLRASLSAQLSQAIGMPPRRELLPWPDKIPENLPELDEANLIAEAEQGNPALQAARERMRAARAGITLAKTAYLPQFSVGASVESMERKDYLEFDYNSKNPVMFKTQMSVPLWWNKYNAGLREAYAMRNEASAMLEDKQNRVVADLRAGYFQYADARRRAVFFSNTLIPKAEEGLQVSQTALSADRQALTGILDAQRNLLELRLMYERARIDQAIRLAELEVKVGRQLGQKP